MDNEETFILVDVRDGYQYIFKHLPQAISLPLNTGDAQIAGFLALPKDELIFIYWGWADDEESAISVGRFLEQDAGFDPQNIFIMWKGIDNWEGLGYPTEN